MAAVRRSTYLISVVVLATSAACADDFVPSAPSSPATYEVPLSGTVRDGSGAPIAAATVIGSVKGFNRINRTGETGADGRFAFSLPMPLFPEKLSLRTVASGYEAPVWEATHRPGSDTQIDIRLQRALSVTVNAPLSSELNPNDPSWTFGYSRSCSPCQRISIDTRNSPNQSYVVSVAWPATASPTLWLYGSVDYDRDFEVAATAGPGRQFVEATIPAGYGTEAYVGLPGLPLAEPFAYSISVRPELQGAAR